MVGTNRPRGQSASDGFTFRSDRLALDFAATRMFRGEGASAVELLDAPDKVARWSVASGLLPVAPPSSSTDLRSAVGLREAVYRIAATHLWDDDPHGEDVEVLNRWGSRPPLAVALGSGATLVRSGTMHQVLATVARDAVELLGGEDADRLRQCGRPGCTRLFVDRTRGRTRMWCGMRECGNRVNAAAYRRRRAAGASVPPVDLPARPSKSGAGGPLGDGG
jgi:predicted RNA-binding Zn ribbon-like protein